MDNLLEYKDATRCTKKMRLNYNKPHWGGAILRDMHNKEKTLVHFVVHVMYGADYEDCFAMPNVNLITLGQNDQKMIVLT